MTAVISMGALKLSVITVSRYCVEGTVHNVLDVCCFGPEWSVLGEKGTIQNCLSNIHELRAFITKILLLMMMLFILGAVACGKVGYIFSPVCILLFTFKRHEHRMASR